MRSYRWVVAPLALAAVSWTGMAHGVSFDTSGNLSFDPAAQFTESFESFSLADAGAAQASVEKSASALHGSKVLRLTLADEAFAIALPLTAGKRSYRLSYWIKGDCVGGAAIDYDDATPGVSAQAYPTGKISSDGWVEMRTAAWSADAGGAGVDARMYLRAYDASQPASVDVDAVELVQDGDYLEPVACQSIGDSGCSAEQVCVARVCRDARGWFPPLPAADARDRFVTYWKQRIANTFGPYQARKNSMPEALIAIEQMRAATTNVAFWSKMTEVIRLLRDAHTYTRSPFMSEVRSDRPLNACFVQGIGNMSQATWPTNATWPDVLVSHVGPDHNWGLKAGDRLVAVDGMHPLAWVKTLLKRSYWAWEADDPAQLANHYQLLRSLIVLHATKITVIRCDSTLGTCSKVPEVIDVGTATQLNPGETIKLVGCDNRPSYHVDGAPVDHNFANELDNATVVEGPLLQTSDEEKIRGLVWNTLYGDGQHYAVDEALLTATTKWQSARGVIQDHREGHGGTTETAKLLVSFSRKPFVGMVNVKRMHAKDEGPADLDEGKEWFDALKGTSGIRAGSSSSHTEIPVALLLTWDVSASDFLPYLLKGGEKVRLFGPGPTMGAFGTFYQYSYWGGLLWSISAADSISPEGLPLSGHGVIPDVIVVPTQSDLLKGKDTIHDAALTWVREELAP